METYMNKNNTNIVKEVYFFKNVKETDCKK